MLPFLFARLLRRLEKIHLRYRRKSRSTAQPTGTILLMNPPINALCLALARRNTCAKIVVLPVTSLVVPAIYAIAFVRISFLALITVILRTKHLLFATVVLKRSTAALISISIELLPLTVSTELSLQNPEPVSTSQKMISRSSMNW